MNRILSIFFIIMPVLLTVRPALTLAEDEPVIFFTLLEWDQGTDARYSFFFTELFEYIREESGVEAERKHIWAGTEFFEYAASEGPKFTIVGNWGELVRLIKDFGYSPAFVYTMSGLEHNRACLYVSDDSGIEDIEGLRGKTISIYGGAYIYSMMWELIGGPPEDFFGRIELGSNEFSAMYLFSLQEVDAFLTSDQAFQFMKLNNPGVTKNLRKLGCSHPYMFLPLLHSKDVPESLLEEMHDLLSKVAEGKALKKYYGIVRLTKLTFKKVGVNDYASDVDFFEKAEEAGKVKRYWEWRDSLKDEE